MGLRFGESKKKLAEYPNLNITEKIKLDPILIYTVGPNLSPNNEAVACYYVIVTILKK